jgi:hypothetical protein
MMPPVSSTLDVGPRRNVRVITFSSPSGDSIAEYTRDARVVLFVVDEQCKIRPRLADASRLTVIRYGRVALSCSVCASVVVAVVATAPLSMSSGAASAAAAISGRAALEGMPPSAAVIRLDADPGCVALNNGNRRAAAEDIVVGESNALRNVFVYVSHGLEAHRFPVPATSVSLNQEGCRYVPRVLGVQVGQPLIIRNSDPLLHNVRAGGKENQPFNLGQPVEGVTVTRTFTAREVMVPVRCDVHGWMNAYIGVLDHPFHAVTDQSGRFSLPGVPPGTYTITAWHEKLGTREQQVTVGERDVTNVEFTFEP